jgi:hypothetical protein
MLLVFKIVVKVKGGTNKVARTRMLTLDLNIFDGDNVIA